MKTEIGFWSCLIISMIWLNGDKPSGELWSLFWFAGASLYMFFGSKE